MKTLTMVYHLKNNYWSPIALIFCRSMIKSSQNRGRSLKCYRKVIYFFLLACEIYVSPPPPSELEKKHELKMQSLRDELELRRKTEIHEIEEVYAYNYYSN